MEVTIIKCNHCGVMQLLSGLNSTVQIYFDSPQYNNIVMQCLSCGETTRAFFGHHSARYMDTELQMYSKIPDDVVEELRHGFELAYEQELDFEGVEDGDIWRELGD